MNFRIKILFSILVFFSLFAFVRKESHALRFTLVEPSGSFVQGQDVEFKINIDTQGETLTTVQVNLSYKTQYLQYISASPGAFFPNVAADDLGGGMVQIAGSVNSGEPGKTGTGLFASIVFRIIYDASGQTDLCTIISNTPTPVPTTPLGAPTNTPVPEPTSPPGEETPVPTQSEGGVPPIGNLPESGTAENIAFFVTVGTTLSLLGLFIHRKAIHHS
jgi:hypothetical protein